MILVYGHVITVVDTPTFLSRKIKGKYETFVSKKDILYVGKTWYVHSQVIESNLQFVFFPIVIAYS